MLLELIQLIQLIQLIHLRQLRQSLGYYYKYAYTCIFMSTNYDSLLHTSFSGVCPNAGGEGALANRHSNCTSSSSNDAWEKDKR